MTPFVVSIPHVRTGSLSRSKNFNVGMGPEDDNLHSLLSRPRVSWDIKSVPWTEWKGDQLEYAKDVCRWCAFHDNLPADNSKKIVAQNHGIVLISQLYGRAKDLCEGTEAEVIESVYYTDLIIDTIYKRDPLSVV